MRLLLIYNCTDFSPIQLIKYNELYFDCYSNHHVHNMLAVDNIKDIKAVSQPQRYFKCVGHDDAHDDMRNNNENKTKYTCAKSAFLIQVEISPTAACIVISI